MTTHIETSDAGFNLQLKTFVSKIPGYATLFGLSTAQINAVKADSLAFDYALSCAQIMQTFAHNYTEYKTQLLHANITNLGGFPTLPVLPAAPAAVPADIKGRFRTLIQSLIHNPNKVYTQNIGEDLGIAGPASNFDPATGKPKFTIAHSAGGHPKLNYTKGSFEGVEIWKDTGAGFLKLERITQTTYIDPSALPAANAAAVWKYKLIYLYKDAVAGEFSDVVSITVNGQTGTTPATGGTATPVTPPAGG